ncbi:MAG TPA: DUF4157 domain-containing protein [Solirubrobacteraceae bacterium]|nr:DUF4157 domain-containing protein [Solirubrobacteraceae bacterium]
MDPSERPAEQEAQRSSAAVAAAGGVPAVETTKDPLAGLLRGSPEEVLGSGSTARDRSRLMHALQRSAGNSSISRLLRELAPPQAAPAEPQAGAPEAETRLVADNSDPQPGQMRLSDFLAQLKPALCGIAESRLGDQAQGCPWIEYWIASYGGRQVAEVEQVVLNYAPVASGATSAEGLIAAMCDRVSTGITTWQQTGQLDVPGVSAAPGAGEPGGGAPGAGGQVSLMREQGSIDSAPQAHEVIGRLGPGRALDASVATRMGAALGSSFADVQLHDDPAAATTTSALGARALAVGNHIAFGPNEYRPGTALGDALLAHELAHVMQQAGSGQLDRSEQPEAAFELDADAAALSALQRLYGGPASRGLGPALRSGLRLQRCKSSSTTPPGGTTAPPSTAPPSTTTAAGPNVMAGTHVITPAQQSQIEAILHPGSTVAPTGGVSSAPPMTDAGPGKSFEHELLAALTAFVRAHGKIFRAKKAHGPTMPTATVEPIAKAAQAEVETHFSAWIGAAGRTPSDDYQPGSFDMGAHVDETPHMPVDRNFWGNYWAETEGKAILTSHHFSSPRDDAELARVVQIFINDPANATDIDDTVHNWPGVTSGSTVYVDPYADVSTTSKLRKAHWDVFTTLLHEMLHVAAHPNFVQTHGAVGGAAEMELREGFCDLMRHDIWDAPGNLKTRIAGDATLREKVEGGSYPYDAGVVLYHSDYPELAQARQVAAVAGMDNCKAAYFMGRTELLGLGPSSSAATPLTDHTAAWHATDAAEADIYVAKGGETLSEIGLKCGVEETQIAMADGKPVPSGYAAAAGDRLKVPGITYIHAIASDTLATIARQYGVTESALAAANGLTAGATLTPGQRLLVPHARP